MVVAVGNKAEIKKVMTAEAVQAFGEVSGDFNVVHFDDEYAAGTVFGKRIVHGMLVASLISNVIGNKMPGLGTIYLKQNLKFLKPVYIGDEITAVVEVISVDGRKVDLKTTCANQNGDIVIDGTAFVSMSKS